MLEAPRASDAGITRELTSLLYKSPQTLARAINSSDDPETFHLSTAGVVLRILRGPATEAETCAVIEIYGLDGNLLLKSFKGFESTSLFSLQYPDEITRSEFFLLKNRPSFIPAYNNSYRSEINADYHITRRISDHMPIPNIVL